MTEENAAVNRATVFGSIAEDYGRLRPPPCDDAVDWLLPSGAGRVLDLAAGAGTLTRLIAARVADVVAVEPDDRMREVLSARNPGVTALSGSAEAIPLPDGSVDGVVVSSAWHWFDPRRAVPEIARVLRPGGRLGVVWNGLDDTVPWVKEWRAAARPPAAGPRAGGDPAPAEVSAPQREHLSRGERLTEALTTAGSPFTAPEHAEFTCTRARTPAEAAALLGTYSRVLILPEEQRRALLARAEQALQDRSDLLSPDGTVSLPFRSLCWRARRA